MSKMKKVGLVLLSLSFLLIPFQNSVPAKGETNADNNNTTSNGEEVLEGKERMEYLKLLENDNLFNEKVSTKSIEKNSSQVVLMTSTVEDPSVDEFILVSGTIENSKKYAFYAVIDINSEEVKRITKMEFDHVNEYLDFYDYDYDGTLVVNAQMTFDELTSGEGIAKLEKDRNQLSAPSNPKDKWWWSWACNFNGVVACSAGCVAFIPLGPVGYGVCTTACTYFWGSGLC